MGKGSDFFEKWYVVRTVGDEMEAKKELMNRVEQLGLRKKIMEVFLPFEEKLEIRSGKKRVVKSRFFSGYIMIKLNVKRSEEGSTYTISEDVWSAVCQTKGISNFVVSGSKYPEPLSDKEVRDIFVRVEKTKGAPLEVDLKYGVGDIVEISRGSLAGVKAKVTSIDRQKGEVCVTIGMFNKEVPMTLDFESLKRI